MTPEQFVTWLQGFVEGSNAYNLTPAGWDAIKAKLKEVGKFQEWPGMLTTEPLPPYNPQPYYYTSPSLPDEKFKITCNSTGVSPLKYYNSKGEEVYPASVTTAKPSAITPTSVIPTPPFEKVDVNEDTRFQPKPNMSERYGYGSPAQSFLTTETNQEK